jgi:hypothetical protein
MANIKTADDVTIYKPARGMQVVLGIVYFLVVLFVLNALAGSIWLITHNLFLDALIFFVMCLAGLALLFYATIFLFAASHMEVRLGAEKAIFVLPDWHGPTPLLPYFEYHIPYADIASVETRGEIYRYFILPVIVQSACLVRKDGKRITLGYVRDHSEDPSMPFPAIAESIAKKAGVALIRRGFVEGNQGLRALIQEEPGWEAPELPSERLIALRKRENTGWKSVVVVLAVVLAMAVTFQLYRLYG